MPLPSLPFSPQDFLASLMDGTKPEKPERSERSEKPFINSHVKCVKSSGSDPPPNQNNEPTASLPCPARRDFVPYPAPMLGDKSTNIIRR